MLSLNLVNLLWQAYFFLLLHSLYLQTANVSNGPRCDLYIHSVVSDRIWRVSPFSSQSICSMNTPVPKCNAEVLPMREQLANSTQDKSLFLTEDLNWTTPATRCIQFCVDVWQKACAGTARSTRSPCSRFINPCVHILLWYNFVIMKLSAQDRAQHPLQQLSTQEWCHMPF